MNKIQLFFEALKNIKTVGTVTFSSKYLVNEMIKAIDFREARYLVELGAGNGCITKGLLDRMHPDARLLSFEINERFCGMLHNLNDKRLTVACESAEKLEDYLNADQQQYADAIVSALPMVWLPDELNNKVLDVIMRRLKPGGHFIQLSYKRDTQDKFKHLFPDLEVHFTPLNLPPAFAFVCTKKPEASPQGTATNS